MALVASAGAALAACSGGSPQVPDAGPTAEAVTDVDQARCEVGEPVLVNPPDVLDDPWLVRGPDGPRVLGFTRDQSLWWSDRAHTGLSTGETPPRVERVVEANRGVAWTGRRYLATDGDAVTARDNVFGSAVPVRTGLPVGMCDPSLVELSGRALLTWRRPPRGGTCETGAVAWVQVLGPTGEPLGAPRLLSPGERDFQVGPVRGRWDFGRAVIEARDMAMGQSRYWVLDPWGAELTRGASGRVACPRSGCVRVRAVSEAAGSGVDGAAQVLRLDPLDGAPGFSTSAVAAGVSALAVSGDRLLVLHPDGSDGSGCRATVIDVARHAVLAEFGDESLACDDARVRPTATGFLVLLHDTNRDLPRVATRTITCAD